MKNEFASRSRVFTLIFLAVLLLGACFGCTKLRQNEDIPSEQAQGFPASGRMSQDDVNLYLELMRAGAARVKNLLPADEVALAKMNKLQDDIEAGRIPTPAEDDPEAEIIARGMKLQHAMDEVIAEEKEMDVAHYTAVRDLIESIVNPSGIIPDEVDEGSGRPMTPAQAQAFMANKKILAPHAPEIERLYQVVRVSLSGKPK